MSDGSNRPEGMQAVQFHLRRGCVSPLRRTDLEGMAGIPRGSRFREIGDRQEDGNLSQRKVRSQGTLMFERDLVLPEKDRQMFKEPLGTELYDSDLETFHAQTTLLTVGDVVSLTFRRHGIRPFLSIYDGITERREMTEFASLVEDEDFICIHYAGGSLRNDEAD